MEKIEEKNVIYFQYTNIYFKALLGILIGEFLPVKFSLVFGKYYDLNSIVDLCNWKDKILQFIF